LLKTEDSASTETRREVGPSSDQFQRASCRKLNTSGQVRSGSKVFDDFGDGLVYLFYVAYLPAKVLTAAAFARFSSRQEHTFAEKMLSAMAEPNSSRINSSMTAIGSSPGNALAIVLTGALKRVYREQLCDELQGVRFFYLKIDYEVVARRLELRTDHFFDKRLLDSQFATLEEPQPNEAFVIDQNRPLAEVVQEVLHYVHYAGPQTT
jgi:hypothetical protein